MLERTVESCDGNLQRIGPDNVKALRAAAVHHLFGRAVPDKFAVAGGV
jgi:hypothetical protein